MHIPPPLADERPTVYSERIAQWYGSWNTSNKSLGQYFTPSRVADFMAHLVEQPNDAARILDPGAGIGVLSCALCESLTGDIELDAYELDTVLIPYLEACLGYAQRWMKARQRTLHFNIMVGDFVTACAWALQSTASDCYDLVIANPPYFKLAKSDPLALASASIVHGQPNIYALFMAIGAALLKPGGQLVCITPRSYAAGHYFSRFREYFFSQMRPRKVHLFESQRDVFDSVLQENVILLAECSTRDERVIVSASANDRDLDCVHTRSLPLSDVLGRDLILRIPLNDEQDQVTQIVQLWSDTLKTYGLEISTGPVVAFRATRYIASAGYVPATYAPLLWLQNVHPMRITWPLPRKNQYISLTSAKLLLPNAHYVILRRFSAKEERRRLIAAPYIAQIDSPFIGLENHLNYIHRPGGDLSTEEAFGLAALLNSRLLDIYFRISSGHTQVNATELRALPLPPLNTTIEIGRRVADQPNIDSIVDEVLAIHA